jgi:hypothetical protein
MPETMSIALDPMLMPMAATGFCWICGGSAWDRVWRDLFEWLRPGVPRTLLDVGTHVGRFVDRARWTGWAAEGLELNPLAAAYAARRTGAPIHCGQVRDLVTAGRRFGAVTLTDVLEHIPQPAPLLVELRPPRRDHRRGRTGLRARHDLGLALPPVGPGLGLAADGLLPRG